MLLARWYHRDPRAVAEGAHATTSIVTAANWIARTIEGPPMRLPLGADDDPRAQELRELGERVRCAEDDLGAAKGERDALIRDLRSERTLMDLAGLVGLSHETIRKIVDRREP